MRAAWNKITAAARFPNYRNSYARTAAAATAITGSGGVSFGVPAPAATGTETFAGPGGVSFGAPALTGAAVQTFSATGGVAFGAPALAATGAEGFAGTGGVAFGGPALAGSGAGTFDAAGGVAFGGPAFAGSGGEGFDAAGSVTSGPPLLAGVGAEAFDGPGEVAFGGPALDGAGSALNAGDADGIGGVAFGAPALDGIGTVTAALPPVVPDGGGFIPAIYVRPAFGKNPERPPKRTRPDRSPEVVGRGGVSFGPPALHGTGAVTPPPTLPWPGNTTPLARQIARRTDPRALALATGVPAAAFGG
jgi:hypothetical protein